MYNPEAVVLMFQKGLTFTMRLGTKQNDHLYKNDHCIKSRYWLGCDNPFVMYICVKYLLILCMDHVHTKIYRDTQKHTHIF